jgi:hypothetical protein
MTHELVFGDETLGASLLWQAHFEPTDCWLFEAQGGTLEFSESTAIIDCYDKRGATLWVRREFPENMVIEFAGTCLPPSMGRNLNCFFAADYADGRDIGQVARSGAYQEYHQFPNYIFTLTGEHTRIRRDPGFCELSELMLGSVNDHRYLVRIAKRGGWIQASIDGRLIHDVIDPCPLGTGWIALRTWNSRVVFDRWAVYQPLP